MDGENAYNARLFSGGLRRWVHLARFRWLASALRRHRHMPRRVIELGCFDAKTIDYLPQPPAVYHGFDANWAGGLDVARNRWSGFPNIRLSTCTSPDHLPHSVEPFDTAICMETIEHLPPQDLDHYLDRLAALTSGKVLITVPNEVGLLFLVKWLFKTALYRDSHYRYSVGEFIAAVLGKTERIERHQHKGFNYRRLLAALDKRFQILEVQGLPLTWLPVRIGVTIGIVAGSRGSSVAALRPPADADRSAA